MLGLLPALACLAAPPVETLAFRVDEGDIHNSFYRRGPIAAHVLARGGARPRVILAFPAGNSGAGLWFEPAARPAPLLLEGPLVPVENGAMRGVAATVTSPLGTLVVRRAVLGSVRALRDFEHTGRVPRR